MEGEIVFTKLYVMCGFDMLVCPFDPVTGNKNDCWICVDILR